MPNLCSISTRLSSRRSLARSAGVLVSVVESPRSPDISRRAQRLVDKVRAGAQICFINHVGHAQRAHRLRTPCARPRFSRSDLELPRNRLPLRVHRDDSPLTGPVRVRTSPGSTPRSACPPIASLDVAGPLPGPDETESAQRVVYLAYLFAADMSTIYLCLAQGITDLTREHGWKKARELLRTQADALRSALGRGDLDKTIDLRSHVARPRSYEASVILAKAYEARALPKEAGPVADLGSFLKLYRDGLALREGLRGYPSNPIATPPPSAPKPRAILQFKPKDDSDYVQTVSARPGRCGIGWRRRATGERYLKLKKLNL